MTIHAYAQHDPAAVAAFWGALPKAVTRVDRRIVAEPEPDAESIQFTAFACCRCGAGLARYTNAERRWTCADVIKRTAVGGDHIVRLDAELPAETGSLTTRRRAA